MNAWQWPAWNLDICLRVYPLRLRISCTSVSTWVSVGACATVCDVCMSIFLTFLYLTVDVCLCVFLGVCVCVFVYDAGISGQRNSIPLQGVLSTPATTHTHTHHTSYCWHTHVTTATRYSPRHADREAETTILVGQRFSTWGLGLIWSHIEHPALKPSSKQRGGKFHRNK